MSEAKHASGPLTARYRFLYGKRKTLEIRTEDETAVAKVFMNGDQAKAEALADLLAAAPNLLKACKSALNYADRASYFDLSEAIRKAEGVAS